MKKLLETEELFLAEVEKTVESLKAGIKAIEGDKELDEKSKEFLKAETISLAKNIKETYQNYRRYYTQLRRAVMFDSLEKMEDKN